MKIKKLTSSTAYLLPEGLEDLHAQSLNWLETIAFWKDETRFFANLVKNKNGKKDSDGLADLLQNLEHLHQMLFDYLSEEIRAHERMLSDIIKAVQGNSDANYREVHRHLSTRMTAFEADFRNLKKTIFERAKKW
ncbi:MAG: hypothetical protein RLZZ241_979 [Bacteroidota bacterium]